MSEVVAFSALGEPDLEERIQKDLSSITAVVKENLGTAFSALLLGGGYGRGEGGGIQDSAGTWHPYNDYDLFAIVNGVSVVRMAGLRERLVALGNQLEKKMSIEVEVSPLRAEDLKQLPFTMMWCEMFGGNRMLAGDPAILEAVPSMPPHDLPLIEAVRYLTNRGALLLWALSDDLPAARVSKFIHKAWLAAGAAVLIGLGRFEVGYSRRQAALEALAPEELPVATLVKHHQSCALARLRPEPPPPASEVARQLEEIREALLLVWDWLEKRRTGIDFGSWEAYATHGGLFSESPRAIPGLIVRQVRIQGLSGLFPLRRLGEHPRTRVTRVLPYLLTSRNVPPSVATLLGSEPDWKACAAKCLAVWKRAN